MSDSAGQQAALQQARGMGYAGSDNMNSVASYFVDRGYSVNFAGQTWNPEPTPVPAPVPAPVAPSPTPAPTSMSSNEEPGYRAGVSSLGYLAQPAPTPAPWTPPATSPLGLPVSYPVTPAPAPRPAPAPKPSVVVDPFKVDVGGTPMVITRAVTQPNSDLIAYEGYFPDLPGGTNVSVGST
ncbi:MAG: hypothetical protein EHM35_18475, partial [Planctomycetaceae bacterium]